MFHRVKTILQNGGFLLKTLNSSQDFCCFQEEIFIASMIQKIQMHGAFMLNKKVNNRFRNKAVNIQPCFLGQKQALKETVSKNQT